MPKTSAARAQDDLVASGAATTAHLSDTTGELERLRTALDAKLAELEAALDNPDQSDSLERLVIELARIATREADAAATRAASEAQRAAAQQVSRMRDDAEHAVSTQRTAAADTARELDAARTALAAERAAAATLNRQVSDLDAALLAAQAAARAAEKAAEEAEQRIFVVETLKARELAELRDEVGLEHVSQRAQLEEATELLRVELAATLAAADNQRAELDAAHRAVESLEQRTVEAEHAVRDAEARAAAARLEVDGRSEELRIGLEEGDRRAAVIEELQARLDAAERLAEEERRHRDASDNRGDAAQHEREALNAELEAARETARVASEAAQEAVKAVSELRAQLEFAAVERNNVERALEETRESLAAAERVRDDARAEMTAARDAAHAAAVAAEGRYDELRGSNAVRISDLEAAVAAAQTMRLAAAMPASDVDGTEHDLGDELWSDEDESDDVIDIGDSLSDAAPSLIPPTRRTDRQRINGDVEVQVNDLPAILVDLSVNGAQILSPTALKPNRAVAFVLPVNGRPVVFRGKVVWASFEAADGALTYRGGVFFTHVDPEAIKAFLAGAPYDPKAAGAEIATEGSSSAGADEEPHTERAAATDSVI
jgi:hypothetical protein